MCSQFKLNPVTLLHAKPYHTLHQKQPNPATQAVYEKQGMYPLNQHFFCVCMSRHQFLGHSLLISYCQPLGLKISRIRATSLAEKLYEHRCKTNKLTAVLCIFWLNGITQNKTGDMTACKSSIYTVIMFP